MGHGSEKFKYIVAISLAMVTTLSGAFLIRERKKNDDIHASKEYSIGYLDLNMMNNQLLKKIKIMIHSI